MALKRTVDLLPEIFRTETNRKFLAATLDQLTQEPNLKRTEGYIGRRVGPGVNPADPYVIENTASRADYQLEPAVIFLQPNSNNIDDLITYPGMLDALSLQGGDIARQDRLWSGQYYAWDNFCDFDKFINYSQYYWLASGPDAVDISSTVIPVSDDFEVTRSTNAYTFSGTADVNPVLTLVRGGNYRFEVNQPGHKFWIQAAPGIAGVMPYANNISSRTVLGVDNNGEEQGTTTFNVPLKDAQDFYYTLNNLGSVDLVTDLQFDQINNIYVSEFLSAYPHGIDGITSLNGRTVIFTNTVADAVDGGWEITTQFDPVVRTRPFDQPDPADGEPGTFDTTLYDQTLAVPIDQRYTVWRIDYVYDNDGQPYLVLSSVLPVPNLSKLSVRFGNQWSNTAWYKNASGYFEQIPLLTAGLDVLYYQDGTNPEIFGQIRLVDQSENNPINIDEIIGAKNYTSPNGVTFTNGLKVQFRGPTVPAQYQDLEYYVEGVGTGPGINSRVGFVDGEAYFGASHVYQGQLMTGLVHDSSVMQQNIYPTVEESLLNSGAGGSESAALPSAGVFGATIGNGIRLIPVRDLVTPETYTRSATTPYDSNAYDSTPYDATLNAPTVPDYLTINRAAQDRDAWSRSNRWFHIDVIRYSAELNNVVPVLDNDLRAKRPIIEFRAGLRLFNFGTQGKQAVDIIDIQQTDALSNINGLTGYGVDGYTFMSGSRVIFAADVDPMVRDRIWVVNFIDPDNSGQQIIDLVPAQDAAVLVNQTVVSLSGVTQQGLSYWYNGVEWQLAQQKTSVNQAPLFDVYDIEGHSFSNRAAYPSTDFDGTKLFSYALGTTEINDSVLGFPLRYLNINNVGDIVFENHLYSDTFRYVQDKVGIDAPISTGFVRQYIDRVSFSTEIGWQTAVTESRSRQIFRFVYDGSPLVLDVPVNANSALPALQIFLGSEFVNPSEYSYTTTLTNTYVTMPSNTVLGTVIEVQALSDVVSAVGYYQVPINLENNAFNKNSNQFTLGTIRTHYESIGQNLKNLQGPINGANNSRDLGNIVPYGDLIVQHSTPLLLTGTFLRKQQFELFNALRFNSVEYNKYKAVLLDLAAKGDFINLSATQVLDTVLQEIAFSKTQTSPFYWSDMVPAGGDVISNTYTYTPISTPTFDTVQTYDFTSSNYLGLLVYLNGTLLTKNYDYVVNDGPTLTVTVPLNVGDVVTIVEYPSTVGNYVPNTPTKMGLYPAFRPEIFVDSTAVTPTLVIRGHDGSITKAYGDIRDTVLLEFETRIFNNLKITSPAPLTADEIIPGQFRNTDYGLAEVNEILAVDFLSWAGWNKLDYVTQTYDNNNPWTWNYNQSSSRIDGKPIPGAWRGAYQYFYDTTAPNTRPWEMLGISERPTWWEDAYGPAPYTSGNMVLWGDLELGLVADPVAPYINPLYARPGLSYVIPSGSEGELLPPLPAVVGTYDATSFRRSWAFGDDGPTEAAWRNSSAYPFAVMRLLALTKPAKFFSLFVDRDRYVFDDKLDQYLWDGRYRLDAATLSPIYGQGTSRASYVNWIVDYNQQLGINSGDSLETTLTNLDTRLTWRTGAFTDKNYLKLYSERSTPTSSNTSLLLPDESYQVLLYKNQNFERVTYSSVIVQNTDDGWAVYGYDPVRPYFEILTSRVNGLTRTLSVAGLDVRVPTQYTNDVTRVPYGYVFTNRAAMCDFLISYGELLLRQGFAFERMENGYIMDWSQMAQEFLYWSQQGWITGSIINLNPGATAITVTRPGAVADSILPVRADNAVLNQNRQPFNPNDLIINRIGNSFGLATTIPDTINFFTAQFTNYENVVVLDNVTVFADLIYQTTTGARQSRILVSGWLTGGWDGTVNAPGFILNQTTVSPWQPNRTYTKGEIVLYKNQYWAASTIIQPGQDFNYSLWLKSDYDQIQTGMLPNAAGASDQLQTAYSVYDTNLEREVDLFSYGLIGFRPREYMQALNLNDTSQVQLYQQFLGTKGTRRATEFFSLADLGKEIAEYRISEYWQILKSVYGANANRSYYELLLNQALLTSDPGVIQVVLPQQASQANQSVLVENIWKSSYKITSPDILPTTTNYPTDLGLPTAGYVNFDDVDLTLFSLDDPQALNADLARLGQGTTVWVAKSNAYDWSVYRCELIPARVLVVTDNLDGRSVVTFSAAHGLGPGDYCIIKDFDDRVNGVYVVRAVPGIFDVIIDFAFIGSVTTVQGQGVAFTLNTVRVAQASDIASLPYATTIGFGQQAWVDDNGDHRWVVLQKQETFAQTSDLDPQFSQSNSEFGSSISQGFTNQTALIGSPAYGSSGGVYPYFRNDNDQYEQQPLLELPASGTQSFGTALDMGNQQWAIAGAPDSFAGVGYAGILRRLPGNNVIDITQLLVPPDLDFAPGRFGDTVTTSADERWMFVGAPGLNKVYAYTRVPVQTQTVNYVTNGTQFLYNWADHIVITAPAGLYPQQISVILNNEVLVYGSQWLLSDNNIVLLDVPPANQLLRISRNSVIQLDQQYYYNVEPTVNTGIGTGAKFDVSRQRGTFTVTVAEPGSDYQVGDVLTLAGDVLGSGNVTAGSFTPGASYIITALGTTDFTLIGAASNTVGEIFVATGAGTGTGTAAENVVLTLTQVGSTYVTNLVAGLDTFTVPDPSEFTPGQSLIKISGAGNFGPGALVLSVDVASNTVTTTQPNLTAGTIEFYAEPNGVFSWSQTGTGVGTTSVFALDPYLATATNIYSFLVTVNGQLYRPEIDYDFNSDSALDSLDLVFNTVPPAGAYILVSARDYWQNLGILSIAPVTTNFVSVSDTTLTLGATTGIYPGMYISGSGFVSGLHYVTAVLGPTQIEISQIPDSIPSGNLVFEVVDFGNSVTTTTDGRTVAIGCRGRTNAPGSVFVFRRGYETFQVSSTATTTFNTVNSILQPTNVTVNGEFLTNTVLNLGGEFTVTGANTVSVSAPLSAGDFVTVDTNQFELIQQIQGAVPYEGARFGYAVDQCINDCSLYSGAPFDGTVKPQAGSVEFWQNQARFYGSTTSKNANPVLVAGDYIQIDGIMVQLQATDIEGNAQPPTVYSLINDINNAADSSLLQNLNPAVQARYRGLSNVVAQALPDLDLVADGVSTEFSTGTLWTAQPNANPLVYVDGVEQTVNVDYTYIANTGMIVFAIAPQNGSVVTAKSGRMLITVKNIAASVAFDRLSVLPGTGTMFDDLGLDIYIWQQTITSPVPQDLANFGKSLFVSDNVTSLIVGAPNADMILLTEFDSGTTTFDSSSTVFSDKVINSGAVYTYDLLPSATTVSAQNPPQFVFGQQITDTTVASLDRFGTAVDYTTGTLLVGAPGGEPTDSQLNYGSVKQWLNADLSPVWKTIHFQQPVVDTRLLNTVFMYDQITNSSKQYFDFFDPLQGRLLGVVRQNLDYIGPIDPASYNVGPINNLGTKWGPSQVGQMWWDITSVRFIDPNQDDIIYASRRWGQLFPGSEVDVYQWIESSVPPAQYTGPGTVRDTESYASITALDEQGFVNQVYFFWVRGINAVARSRGKTLGAATVARYIENPRASGISYIAPLNASAVAIYNGLDYISAQDTVLHIEFDKEFTDNAVHVEYQLIPEGKPSGFLSDTLYRKLQDSFCGIDNTGAPVPDPFLPVADRYGVDFRPRQSMFVNRFLALENYLTAANKVLATIPLADGRRSALLDAAEPEPTSASGEWNLRVADLAELSYQDLSTVAYGYRYLVAYDASNDGLWTIYQVVQPAGGLLGQKSLLLVRVQNYDTRKYWDYIDWYAPGFVPTSSITLEVPNYASLQTLTLPENSVVKVTNNGARWELYQLTQGAWLRVALQNGTVEVSDRIWNYNGARYGFDSEVFDAQYFDQEPVIETRKIIQGLNQDVFVGDLLGVRNELLILMFNFILNEQIAPTWLTKTSLIDVDHIIRNLEPFQVYRTDNQDFVRNYIEEVKPYHTQIRQFNLIYRGADQYLGTVNDFDLPAFYDAAQLLYVSPILDNTGAVSTTSSFPSTSEVWQTLPWNQWYQNYLLSIESVSIVHAGSGYTVPPTVVVTGECARPATMTAKINSAGRVSEVEVVDPGEGYISTAIISLEGGNGTGAMAVAVMGNSLVRSINTTIKYDRYEYTSSIVAWQNNTAYAQDTLVRYNDRVWSAMAAVPAAESFDPLLWQLVPAGDLSGVDRTMGYYVPTQNQPGLDLALLISGVTYPGVQVQGVDFNQDTGFDVGAYDINVFDNISYGPDGQPSYDQAILDAVYQSEFLDPYLGVGPAAINVEGGAFVDTYSSHAPEELIPGAIFDTLDMRVFTTPGSDWSDNGHTWPQYTRRVVHDGSEPTVYFGDRPTNTVAVQVFNITTQKLLSLGGNYLVDWANYTVTVLTGASDGDVLNIVTSSLGGGNQLYSASYLGDQLGSGVIIPYPFAPIDNFAVFVNGVVTQQYSWSQYSSTETLLTLNNTYTANDRVTFTAMGTTTPVVNQDWSLPVTQYWVSDGSLSITLTNSLQGVNAVNLIVTVNGIRARPYEGTVHLTDGSSLQYLLPQNGKFNQAMVSDNDVVVYINQVEQVLGVDYVVDPATGPSNRTITLAQLPAPDQLLEIYVRTMAQYFVVGNTLQFRPSQGLSPVAGDLIAITTWNNTSQQDIYTGVWVGPTTQGVQISEAYDDTLYDEGVLSGAPGSFDYSVGTVIETNEFPLPFAGASGDRFTVTLNGNFLFNNLGFTYNGSVLTILGPTIGPADVVAVTTNGPYSVPGAIGFRIFQDMRGIQSTYRITAATTTSLAAPLSASADVIHVVDASKLGEPDLPNGVFGMITIDGERITYRERNTESNTVSGLRRGTAGTGADSHAAGTAVYDIGRGNYLPLAYQDRYIVNNSLANSSQTVFVAEDISVSSLDSTELVEAVQVYVGGTLQTSSYTVTGSDPVTVIFDIAPTLGYQVSIRVRQGLSWYQPGDNTPSNGIALQEQTTQAATFIKGV